MRSLQDEISEITETVWGSLLGLELERWEEPTTENPAAALKPIHTMTGCVHIAGAWEGAVTLHCPTELARNLSGVMFGMQSDEVSDDEVRDALGELANMVGGNVKGLLPDPCRLSLPAVAEGVDHLLAVPGTSPVAGAWFGCEGQPLVVTLLKREENQPTG